MSLSLPFERTKHIHGKYKHTVSGYVRMMQILQIPESIQLVILLFYYNAIESSILTDNECDKLLSLFDEQNKFNDLGNYSYKLIYKGTGYGTEMSNFVSRCYEKPNLLCIISATNGDVFGGYTAKGWKKEFGGIADSKAFLFLIRSSKGHGAQIMNAIKDATTIRTMTSFYCVFGTNYAIWIHDHGMTGGCYLMESFEQPSYGGNLAGDITDEDEDWTDGPEASFHVLELEVFQLTAE